MSMQSRTTTRSAALAIAISALALTSCAASAQSASAPTADATSALGDCGTVPQLGANDPDDLLAEFSEDVVANYNGFPTQVRASSWADWAPDHEGPYTAAIVTTPPVNAFQQDMIGALREALGANDITIVGDFAPASPTDVPQQLQQFDQAVALEPDIIFFQALAAGPAAEAVASAKAAGIPVIGIHNSIDSPDAVSVGFNNVLQAMETSAQVFAAMNGEGSVLRVHGIPGIAQDTDSSTGFEATMKLCPGITQSGEVTGFYQAAQAQSAVLQYLATNPAGVGGVLQSGVMGLGVLQAFTESGQEPAPIADLGATKGFLAWAAANPDYPYVGTGTPSEHMGQTMADVGLRVLAGQGPKVNQLVTSAFVIDSSNLDEYVDPSWSESDQSDAPGNPDAYFPEDALNQYFNDPDASN